VAKLTKRAKLISDKVQPGKIYAAEEAFEVLKSVSSVKFVEAVDVAVILGVDPRKSDQAVRGATVLPNGTGKTSRVAVFAQGANAEAATEAGADIVGMDDLAAQVKAGQMDLTSSSQLRMQCEWSASLVRFLAPAASCRTRKWVR